MENAISFSFSGVSHPIDADFSDLNFFKVIS
jgi:hypothetical protein